VLIRCEKCTTLYELDEKLLPPQGAPVQCSKCQYVFTAYPPAPEPAPHAPQERAPEPAPRPPEAERAPVAAAPQRSAAPAPEQPAVPPAAPAAPRPDTAEQPREAGATQDARVSPDEPLPGTSGASARSVKNPAAAAQASQSEPRFTPDGRPIRKVPFPSEEPLAPGSRPPGIRVQPRVGASGGRRSRDLRPWIISIAVVVVLALAFVAWRAFSARGAEAGTRRRGDGRSLQLRERRAALVRAVPPLAVQQGRASEPLQP
jgi:predicted Zn finger-like uncharacterized protein